MEFRDLKVGMQVYWMPLKRQRMIARGVVVGKGLRNRAEILIQKMEEKRKDIKKGQRYSVPAEALHRDVEVEMEHAKEKAAKEARKLEKMRIKRENMEKAAKPDDSQG
jgi:hypothetical protein